MIAGDRSRGTAIINHQNIIANGKPLITDSYYWPSITCIKHHKSWSTTKNHCQVWWWNTMDINGWLFIVTYHNHRYHHFSRSWTNQFATGGQDSSFAAFLSDGEVVVEATVLVCPWCRDQKVLSKSLKRAVGINRSCDSSGNSKGGRIHPEWSNSNTIVQEKLWFTIMIASWEILIILLLRSQLWSMISKRCCKQRTPNMCEIKMRGW